MRCVLVSMADPQIDRQTMRLGITVIAVGFAVTILRNYRTRSLSAVAFFVVGYVLNAAAQNSTPGLDNPAAQIAPILKPLEPENSANQAVPNLENLSSESDNPAMQTLKSLAPKLENPPTQAIPDP